MNVVRREPVLAVRLAKGWSNLAEVRESLNIGPRVVIGWDSLRFDEHGAELKDGELFSVLDAKPGNWIVREGGALDAITHAEFKHRYKEVSARPTKHADR